MQYRYIKSNNWTWITPRGVYLTPKWIQVCPRDIARAVKDAGAKNTTLMHFFCMGAKFLKSDPYGCKTCEKGTFERVFLTKFEFSVLIFVKIVKTLTPYGCKNLPNPTLMGALRALKTHPYGCKFFKNRDFLGGTSAGTRSTPPPLSYSISFFSGGNFDQLYLNFILTWSC